MTGGSDPDPRAVRVQDLYTRRQRSYEPYVQAFGHRQGIQAVLESSRCCAQPSASSTRSYPARGPVTA